MLNENKLNYREALKVLGATGKESSAELSKLFKRASLKNHPDRGGSTSAMQQINQAYDVVSRVSSTGSVDQMTDYRAAREKEAQEFRDNLEVLHAKAKSYFSNQFNAQEFAEYFTSFTGKPTTFTMRIVKNTINIGIGYEFKSGEGHFDFSFWVSPATSKGGLVAPDSSSLGNVTVATGVLVGTKKYKMAAREYDWKARNPDRITPESLFPKAKMNAIFKPSAAKAGKAKVYKRADYMASFGKILNARVNGNDIDIDVGDLTIKMYRNVMMRQGYYSFYGIYSPHTSGKFKTKVENLSGMLFEDPEGETLNFILELMQKMQKEKPAAAKLAQIVQHAIKNREAVVLNQRK